MRNVPTFSVPGTILLLLVAICPAAAQGTRAAVSSNLAQAERSAAELRQGMSLGEVQKLLGKPRRTALRQVGSSSAPSSQGALQWTYSWGPSTQDSLQIEFAAKAPDEWYVSSWQWASY